MEEKDSTDTQKFQTLSWFSSYWRKSTTKPSLHWSFTPLAIPRTKGKKEKLERERERVKKQRKGKK